MPSTTCCEATCVLVSDFNLCFCCAARVYALSEMPFVHAQHFRQTLRLTAETFRSDVVGGRDMDSPQGSVAVSGQGTNGTASVRSASGGSTGQGGEVSFIQLMITRCSDALTPVSLRG